MVTLKESDKEMLLFRSRFLKQKDYWLEKLSGELDNTYIGVGNTDHQQGKSERRRVEMSFNNQLSSRVLMLTKQSDLSIYILLLSALKSLLFRCTANEDIITISPVNKLKVTKDPINSLVFIRDRVDHRLTFKELVLNVRQSVLEAYENQDYPYDKLLQYLSPSPGEGNTRMLTNISCSLENLHDNRAVENKAAGLSFYFLRAGDRISGYIMYDTGSGSEKEMVRLAGHLACLLANAVKDVNVRIAEVFFLTEQEKKQLLVDFNDNKANYPRDRTIYHLLEEGAGKNPHATALGFTHHEITYREITRRTAQMARRLKNSGIGEGSLVGILLARSPLMVESILGVWKAGGAYIPLDPAYPYQRIRDILIDSQARVLITDTEHCPPQLAESYNGTLIRLDEEVEETNPRKQEEEIKMNMNRLSYVIYTSGSTGKPKGAMVEHDGMMNHIAAKIHDLQLVGKSIISQNSSHTFDISIWQFFAALAVGGKTVIYPDEWVYDPLHFIARLIEDQVTVLEVVPSYLMVMLELLDTKVLALNTLRCLLVTGETVKSTSVKKWFEKYPGIPMVNAYGPTEASDDITHFVMEEPFPGDRIPLGKPIQNLAIYIMDQNMNLCPLGVNGEICVSGVGVGRGYLNNPELTAEKFINCKSQNKNYKPNDIRAIRQSGNQAAMQHHSHYPITPIPQFSIYRTGDLGRWLTDGNIEFLGRKDHQVKIRGFRIELGEIEHRLSTHPAIKTAVVTVKEDKAKDLCAYLVPLNHRELDITAVKEYLARRLPDYMIPAYIVEIKHIPLTPNGKIDMKALSGMDAVTSLVKHYTAPRSDAEVKLAEIYSQVLGIKKDNLGIESGFFEIGGNSLTAAIIVARIHKEFDVHIPLREVFRNPTIEGISSFISIISFADQKNVDTHQEMEEIIL